jgi:protein-S-isoprenylcysteine O-methyltransferase Ste14
MLARLIQLVTLQIAHPELIVQAAAINVQAMLLVVSETLGVLLVLMRRRATVLSSHPLDWALAFAAINLPLLAVPAAAGTRVPEAVSVALMLAGLVIQIAAKLTLGRSFGIVAANRGVKTGGLYRVVRHPMYAGYTLIHIGFLLGFPSLRNALLYLAALGLEIARALREEAVLDRDPVYRTYAARVRYRLLPGVF